MFEEVRSAVSALEVVSRGLEPWRLDGRDASGLVELAARCERICASIKALGARRVEETKVWRERGHRSAAHWVAEATGETVGAAERTLETTRALDALPETGIAFPAGELSMTQAAEITSAAGADPNAESVLLETAAETSVKVCATGVGKCALAPRATTALGRGACTSSDAPTNGPIPTARITSAGRWRLTRALGSARLGRRTSTGSSTTPAAQADASHAPPTPPTRSWSWLQRVRASRSTCGSLSTARRWRAVTRSQASGARSRQSVRCLSRPRERCWTTRRSR